MPTWDEVADGVFQRRYEPLDVSVTVVRGGDGLLVVDTRSSHRQAAEIIADLRVFGPHTVKWVVNTHAHFDHAFGNGRFGPGSTIDAPIYGHERVPEHLQTYEVPMLARWIEEQVEPVDEWREVVITPPTHLVGDHAALDLGGRTVELRHLGRGHTDNDLIISVPDAGAWLVGDLLEESGPPMYGSGSFPLEWPATVLRLIDLLPTDATIVPGHGAPVGTTFAVDQQRDLQLVADLIIELHAAGISEDEAVAAGGDRWPFPAAGLGKAVTDAYGQLRAR